MHRRASVVACMVFLGLPAVALGALVCDTLAAAGRMSEGFTFQYAAPCP